MANLRLPELNDQARKDIKHAFDILAPDSSGTIELKDVKVALQALGFEPKKDEAKNIVSSLEQAEKDPLRNSRVVEGRIAFSTFLEIMQYKWRENDPDQLVSMCFDSLAHSNGRHYGPLYLVQTL